MNTPVKNWIVPNGAEFAFVVKLIDDKGEPLALPDGAGFVASAVFNGKIVNCPISVSDSELTVRASLPDAGLMRTQWGYAVYMTLNNAATLLLSGVIALDPTLAPASTVQGDGVIVRYQDGIVALKASIIIGAQGRGSSEWDGGTITVPTTCDKVSLTVGDPNGEAGINGSIILSPEGTLAVWHGGTDQRTVIQGNYILTIGALDNGASLSDERVPNKKQVVDIINSIINQ